MPRPPRFTTDEIASAVRAIARRLSEDYSGRRPVLVGVLKGCFVFMADLIRELTIPVEITKDVESDLAGRDVIVVEDIADTGLTMEVVVERIRAHGAASVARCALLAREGSPSPEYRGFVVAPGFVVGYGIDYAERHRGRSDIVPLSDLRDSGLESA